LPLACLHACFPMEHMEAQSDVHVGVACIGDEGAGNYARCFTSQGAHVHRVPCSMPANGTPAMQQHACPAYTCLCLTPFMMLVSCVSSICTDALVEEAMGAAWVDEEEGAGVVHGDPC
jgi:hypothetical protein